MAGHDDRQSTFSVPSGSSSRIPKTFDWTAREQITLESAVKFLDRSSGIFFEEIARRIPTKSMTQIVARCLPLLGASGSNEPGNGSTATTVEGDTATENHSTISQDDPQKGPCGTAEELRLSSEGTALSGDGALGNISNVVRTKTMSEVAGFGQKYGDAQNNPVKFACPKNIIGQQVTMGSGQGYQGLHVVPVSSSMYNCNSFLDHPLPVSQSFPPTRRLSQNNQLGHASLSAPNSFKRKEPFFQQSQNKMPATQSRNVQTSSMVQNPNIELQWKSRLPSAVSPSSSSLMLQPRQNAMPPPATPNCNDGASPYNHSDGLSMNAVKNAKQVSVQNGSSGSVWFNQLIDAVNEFGAISCQQLEAQAIGTTGFPSQCLPPGGTSTHNNSHFVSIKSLKTAINMSINTMISSGGELFDLFANNQEGWQLSDIVNGRICTQPIDSQVNLSAMGPGSTDYLHQRTAEECPTSQQQLLGEAYNGNLMQNPENTIPSDEHELVPSQINWNNQLGGAAGSTQLSYGGVPISGQSGEINFAENNSGQHLYSGATPLRVYSLSELFYSNGIYQQNIAPVGPTSSHQPLNELPSVNDGAPNNNQLDGRRYINDDLLQAMLSEGWDKVHNFSKLDCDDELQKLRFHQVNYGG